MSYNIISSSNFIKDLKGLNKKYPSIRNDLKKLQDSLLENPHIGTPLGKECYKIRFPISSKGKGKRGGGRLITCVKVVQSTIYLISVYDKSEFETIDNEALQIILKKLGLL